MNREICNKLLELGYIHITVPAYRKHTHEGLYMTVEVYSNTIFYSVYVSTNRVKMVSSPEGFDKTYEEFERQCEILSTTLLFSHDN